MEKDEILTSGFAAALYLKSIRFDKKVYVIGSEALKTELGDAGIAVCDLDHSVMEYREEEMSKISVDPLIGCVVVGYDNKINNYNCFF